MTISPLAKDDQTLTRGRHLTGCDGIGREKTIMQEPVIILPAEYVGEAAHGPDGKLRIGEGEHVIELDLSRTGLNPEGYCCWWNTHTVGVYVRRLSNDLSIAEIHMARHDGLAQEELDAQNEYGTTTSEDDDEL